MGRFINGIFCRLFSRRKLICSLPRQTVNSAISGLVKNGYVSLKQLAGAGNTKAVYLTEKGYEILEYNYRCKLGEIDIIARDGDYLVFCEVKYRADDRKGTPAEAVDYAKQRVISKSALYYMTVNGIDEIPCRFDVVSIEDDRIILYQNAFDYVEI